VDVAREIEYGYYVPVECGHDSTCPLIHIIIAIGIPISNPNNLKKLSNPPNIT
jgi:hypothetical protein